MSALNKFMTRGFIPPQVHGILDYPLAAVLIAGPLAIDFDYTAATVIALVFGGGAAILAVAQSRSPFTYLSELITAHARGDPFPALA